MNKNSRNIVIAVVVIIVIILVVWMSMKGGKTTGSSTNTGDTNATSTVQVPVSETKKVSSSLSKYQNAELGFSIQYPTNWQKAEMPSGVQFIVPIDSAQVSTVNRLEIGVTVNPGKCSFPPVTTVDNRGTLTVGASTLNTISMSNTVQGRSYFNHMYSVEKGSICYFFSYSYVALSPDSKGLTGSNLTQAQNNNKAIKTATDEAFTAMVKTLEFVTAPTGQDEASASPKK